MKILIVHYRYFISGGPERYLFNVKEALEEKGHEVIPFSIKNRDNLSSKYDKYFVRNIGDSDEVFLSKYPKTLRTYLDLLDREFYSFYVKKKLQKLIEIEKPDICYLLVYKRALSPSVVDECKKYNIPVINRISDYNTVCGSGSLYCFGKVCLECLNSEFSCVINKCIKKSYIFSVIRFLSIKFHKLLHIDKKIDAFICTNRYMADIMAQYGYPNEKLYVIPTFFREDRELAKQDKRNKVDGRCIEFLFIGNIDETKGIYDLLNAFTLVNREISNFHINIVGGLHVDENGRVQEIVKNNGLIEKVTFVPFVKGKEVFHYYLKANVSILPARWVENLPNTLIESIYFHRPVVVPDFGSFQFTTDETVAFRYKAQSSESLADMLLKICNHPKIIEEKSDHCEAFFREHYSEASHMEKLLRLFEGVRS